MTRIQGSMGKVIARSVKKGDLTESQGNEKIQEVIANITPTIDMSAAKDCDLIIEAIAENMDLKIDFYKTHFARRRDCPDYLKRFSNIQNSI